MEDLLKLGLTLTVRKRDTLDYYVSATLRDGTTYSGMGETLEAAAQNCMKAIRGA